MSSSGSFTEGITRWISTHRSAVIITSLVGASTVAGAYYYYVSQDSDKAAPKPKSSKSKKSKKKQTKVNVPTDTVYPVSQTTGLPSFGSAEVEALSAEDKNTWALALKEQGNQYFKAKNYDAAIACYDSALLCKLDAVYYSNRSACHSALKDDEKTVEDCTAALKLRPDYTKCFIRRAAAYENLGKYAEAEFDLTAYSIYTSFQDKAADATLERVLKKHAEAVMAEKYATPSHELPSAATLSSFFSVLKEELPIEGLPETLEDAEEGSGDYFLLEGIQLIKKDTPESYDAADVALNQACQRYADAEPSLKVAIAFELHGSMLFLKRANDEAKIAYEKAVSMCPERARSHIFLGLLGLDSSDVEAATRELTTALTLEPENPDIHYQIGQYSYFSRELNDAKMHYEKVLELSPDNLYAYIQLGSTYYKLGEGKKCDEIFTEARRKFPTSAEIPYYYGEVLQDRGQLELAKKEFDTAARLQEVLPTFNVGARPLLNKAQLVISEAQQQMIPTSLLDKFEEAKNILVSAAEVDPKSETVKLILGQVYLQLQDVNNAVSNFQEAARLAGTDEDRLQAIALYLAAEMQIRTKEDPVLNNKLNELMLAHSMGAGF
ncbi:unnamed protein product [Kuraishia capsulata CBS 1993]|uniref:TOM70 n=1 Tax=Kuraishia capsulata CBS 1993 TaxID=1382522 RepID=W6MSA9_9ASCO|nr:uncharacterized protein KUCA_T00005674001 [Kuraishia capsulata CBS 1993]CDK29681.1 unnamed protein product [Kuraishia capsulata CBS 1993]